jgi:hypothetical protein
MKRLITIAACFLTIVGSVNGSKLTFDDVIVGATSYSFDSDGDMIDDVIFSTTDPYGFNTYGPGSNMTYIEEPGLEGTSLFSPDLRVEFLLGAVNSLTFGFALDSDTEDDTVTFKVYNSSDVEIASATVTGLYTYPDGTNPSNYPEGEVSVSFVGAAAYATFDFTSDFGRYIIDNFEGTFGSTERLFAIDIKPGSCPNPFNGKSQGSVPVAILGNAVFDVTTVDLDTVRLAGVPIIPKHVGLEDVSAPVGDPEDCYNCFDEQVDSVDGYLDLVVKFDTQELAAAIGPAPRDACVVLTLTGLTLSGEPFEASDSMVIKTKIKD